MSIAELLDLEPRAQECFLKLWLGYTESQGHPALRSEIANLYTDIQPNQVLAHAGAEEAIFNFMHAVLQRGDHVIVHYPCYQSLFEVAASIGCDVTRWEALEENGWELDLDNLSQNL